MGIKDLREVLKKVDKNIIKIAATSNNKFRKLKPIQIEIIDLLLALDESEPITAKTIAEKFKVNPSYIGEICKSIIRKIEGFERENVIDKQFEEWYRKWQV